jgi:hypothetical protein
MTEQEITQARADLALLDIEQLRCGVLLQLLHIEALKKERDEYRAKYNECYLVLNDVIKERDALAVDAGRYQQLQQAAKLALDFVGFCWRDVTLNEYAEDRRGNVEIALRQAGVQ